MVVADAERRAPGQRRTLILVWSSEEKGKKERKLRFDEERFEALEAWTV